MGRLQQTDKQTTTPSRVHLHLTTHYLWLWTKEIPIEKTKRWLNDSNFGILFSSVFRYEEKNTHTKFSAKKNIADDDSQSVSIKVRSLFRSCTVNFYFLDIKGEHRRRQNKNKSPSIRLPHKLPEFITKLLAVTRHTILYRKNANYCQNN